MPKRHLQYRFWARATFPFFILFTTYSFFHYPHHSFLLSPRPSFLLVPPTSSSLLPPRPSFFFVQHCLNNLESVKAIFHRFWRKRDGPTDGLTDGQGLLYRCEDASRNTKQWKKRIKIKKKRNRQVGGKIGSRLNLGWSVLAWCRRITAKTAKFWRQSDDGTGEENQTE